MKKRLFSLVLALILCATVSGAYAEVTKRDVGNGLLVPLVDSEVTLKIMSSDPPSVFGMSLNEDSFPVLERIRENTGVKLVYEAYASSYSENMQARLAAGTDLPDMFVMGTGDLSKVGSGDLSKLGLNDIFADVAPYLNEKNTPNLLKFFEKYPEIKGTITEPNGAIYGLPYRVSPRDAEFSCLVLGYRQDWVDKLGLTAPQTMDDWYQMLKAFKEQDPNGNGLADEIPIITPYPNQLNNFANAYGLSPWSGWFTVTDGVVGFDFTSEANKANMKAYIEEMRKWYAEGLIDSEFSIEHETTAMAAVYGNEAGVEQRWNATFADYNKLMKADVPDVKWQVALPPEGPSGARSYEIYPMMNNDRMTFSAKTENLELALHLYDYIFATEEGNLLATCGIEGVDYTFVDSQIVFTDKILHPTDVDNADLALVRETGGALPRVLNDAYTENILRGGATDEDMAVMKEASQFYRVMFPSLPATKEESDIFSSKYNDIALYTREMMLKYITGKEDMAGYDAFVQQVVGMGIEEVVAAKQAQYDRYAK